MKQSAFLVVALLLQAIAFAQTKPAEEHIFERLATEMKEFKPDTTAVPEDKITAKIRELRQLKGGFNIEEALKYKLQEDREKKTMAVEEIDRFEAFMTTGAGKRWLDNAVIHIYRNHFTYQELKELVAFYKTSAGKKLSADFPVIIVKALAAGEQIKQAYGQQNKTKE